MSRRAAFIACAAALAATFAWFLLMRPGDNSLVVYCAHDRIFAEPLLRQFERDTGIEVVIVSDTEATKSLGLTQQIRLEQDHPRCDVFWNNQTLGTMQLAEEGLLEPYRGSGWQRIPAQYKDAEARWTGFGGRLRVWIVNTDTMEATQAAVDERLAGDDLSRMAIALPMYGTTLTHYSLLWHLRGAEELKAWHHSLVDRGCKVVSGNATVKNLVAEGVCDFGLTDTDDAFVALDDGAPVAQFPVRIDGQTICIPNSVAIIRGTRRRAAAERLVDYLLSAKSELALASSQARQVPLGPAADIPLGVQPLAEWAQDGADLSPVVSAQAECLEWLKSEYAP